QFLFQLLVALFHRPAALPQADRLLATGVRRQVRERVLDLAIGLLFDQQPHRTLAGACASLPAVAGPNLKPGEAAAQLSLGPLAPGHLPPGQTGGQLVQRHGPRGTLRQLRPGLWAATRRGRRRHPRRRLGKDHEVLRDPDDGAPPPRPPPRADPRGAPVPAPRRAPPPRPPLAPSPADHPQRVLRLGRRPPPRLRPPRFVRGGGVGPPLIGQVEAQVQR